MSTVASTPCLEWVSKALPFEMSTEIEGLVSKLCNSGLKPQRVAWIVLHLILKPRAEEMLAKGDEAAPELDPENFNWSLWLEICQWARKQQPPIPKDILRQVFEKVCSRRICELEQAIAVINDQLPHPPRRQKPK